MKKQLPSVLARNSDQNCYSLRQESRQDKEGDLCDSVTSLDARKAESLFLASETYESTSHELFDPGYYN